MSKRKLGENSLRTQKGYTYTVYEKSDSESIQVVVCIGKQRKSLTVDFCGRSTSWEYELGDYVLYGDAAVVCNLEKRNCEKIAQGERWVLFGLLLELHLGLATESGL